MVIALDKGKRPLGFITERRARKLMEARRACVYRYFPFVLIIKDVDARQIPNLPEYRIKIDPGADTDGISIIHDNEILFAMHIQHRGRQVTENMTKRKGNRKNRRNRETRYLKVLHAVGFDKDLLKICADDPLGRLLQDERDNRYARGEQ